MKNKAMRTLALAVALVMYFGVMSLSVSAADEEYVPTLNDITATNFEGILKTSISGIGAEGSASDYYMTYAQDTKTFYTSLDGANWDKRTYTGSPALGSVAYGGAAGEEKGIGITYKALAEAHSPEAYLFSRDMTAYRNDKESEVLPVYNKVKDESDVYIDLVPNIYYDSYSGLFFCYGLQYQGEKTSLSKNGTDYVITTSNATDYLNLNLYYTNGAITKSTYNGDDANILTWTKVSGDYSSTYSFARIYIGRLDVGRVLFDGDAQGNIAVIIGGANSNLEEKCFYDLSAATSSPHPRRYFSLVKIEKDGSAVSEVKAMFVDAAAWVCDLKMADNGKLALWYNGTKASHLSVVYVHNVDNWWNGTATRYETKTAELSTREYSISSAEYNGFIYFLTADGDVYRVKVEDINKNFAPDTIIDADVRTNLEIVGTPKDIEFDNNGNMLLMMSDKLYSITLSTDASTGDVSATAASVLQADETLTYPFSYEYGSDTAVRGYKIDVDTTLRGSVNKNGTAAFEFVSGENIFESIYRYPTVKADTPCDSYDVTFRITSVNQPSFFVEKDMTINVVPYYTSALNSESPSAEADTFTLTGSDDNINITFADKDLFYVTNHSKLDADIDNLCILAAVYDKDTQKIKNTVSTYKVHDITTQNTLSIPVSGNAGDTVRLFVWRDITSLVPFVK